MGTRCITTIVDGNKELLCMYRQFDGYPTGHGAELLAFAKDIVLINGISVEDKKRRTANGIGCFAAQMVAHFKNDAGVGGIYLFPPETREVGEEYVYTLSARDGALWLDVYEGEVAFFGLPGSKPDLFDFIYSGPLADFNPEKAETASVHHG